MLDRRSETRLMCSDMVAVKWKSKSGWERKCTAVLDDISPSGACLQTDVRIPVQTNLEITCSKGLYKGSVAYCFFREIGYYVGVKFAPASRWHRGRYRPKHLLDPKKLLADAPSGRGRQPRFQ